MKILVSGETIINCTADDSTVELDVNNKPTGKVTRADGSVYSVGDLHAFPDPAWQPNVSLPDSSPTARDLLIWNGTAIVPGPRYATALEAAIRAKLQALGAYGQEIEQGGTTVNGFHWDTDDKTQAKLGNAYQLAGTADSPDPFHWWMSNGWHEIAKAQIISDAPVVAAFVETVYSNLKAHFAAIAALTSFAELEAYDFTTGWPTGS